MSLTATVMGAGAWGTTVAKVLADAGNDVRLWARRDEIAEQVNTAHQCRLPAGDCAAGRNPGYHRPAEALDGVTTVLLGVPSQTLRSHLEEWRGHIAEGATLVSLAKESNWAA